MGTPVMRIMDLPPARTTLGEEPTNRAYALTVTPWFIGSRSHWATAVGL